MYGLQSQVVQEGRRKLRLHAPPRVCCQLARKGAEPGASQHPIYWSGGISSGGVRRPQTFQPADQLREVGSRKAGFAMEVQSGKKESCRHREHRVPGEKHR